MQILYLSTDKEQQISCMEHEFSIEEFMNVESAESSDIAKVTADLEDLTISITIPENVVCVLLYIFT